MNLGDVVQGAVRHAMAGVESALANAAATQSSGRFVVNHENVLLAGKIVQSQIDSLRDVVENAIYDLQIDPPGDDVISRELAPAWNWRLSESEDSYSNRVAAYLDSLNSLAISLRYSALSYGYTEEDITSAFGDERA